MNNTYVWIGIIILFITTYFTRMLPLIFCKKPIQNTFFKSLLAYLPYAVLTSMLIPEVFQAPYGVLPGILGFIIAIVLAYLEQSLVVVLAVSTIITYIAMLFNPQIMSALGF